MNWRLIVVVPGEMQIKQSFLQSQLCMFSSGDGHMEKSISCNPGLYSAESSKGQIDQHKFAMGRKVYFVSL